MQHICPDEDWATVPGFEGRYRVSSRGRVWAAPAEFRDSIGRTRRVPGRFLRATITPEGYTKVWLGSGEGKSYRHVHRLILESFVGPCPPGSFGCHWDDDPGHNCLANLRWATPSENLGDSVRNGSHGMKKRTQCPRGHLLSGNNLRSLPSGWRGCKACNRAYAHVAADPSLDFVARADEEYARIRSEQKASR